MFLSSRRPLGPTLIIALLLSMLVAGSAWSENGRIEINQETVNAAGGFPYTIDTPGSYVLTGPLVVPASTDGIVIAVDEVTLDLGGFSITGPAACSTTSCPSGTGTGIGPLNLFFGSRSTTVRNGIVRGFAGDGVRLLTNAYIEGLVVTECGGTGIRADQGSVVTRNRVFRVGQIGISMDASATFSHNTVVQAGLGGGVLGLQGIQGGRAAAGNSCDDGSCSSDGRRRYYLTNTLHTGSQALSACSAGFHMASLWEIFDTTALQYVSELGFVGSDQGAGPPTTQRGWVRTGEESERANALAGVGNCLSWTSSTSGAFGTRATPSTNWGSSIAGTLLSPWVGDTFDCSFSERVWCVED